MSTSNKTPGNIELPDEVRAVPRPPHYSIRTERTYRDRIKRYVRFHGMSCRNDLADGEAGIEAFPTHLAVAKVVAPAARNQALNALVFL